MLRCKLICPDILSIKIIISISFNISSLTQIIKPKWNFDSNPKSFFILSKITANWCWYAEKSPYASRIIRQRFCEKLTVPHKYFKSKSFERTLSKQANIINYSSFHRKTVDFFIRIFYRKFFVIIVKSLDSTKSTKSLIKKCVKRFLKGL